MRESERERERVRERMRERASERDITIRLPLLKMPSCKVEWELSISKIWYAKTSFAVRLIIAVSYAQKNNLSN